MNHEKVITSIALVQLFCVMMGSMACSDANEESPVPGEASTQWFFRAVYGYPVSISFEPLVLFENGNYFEVGITPLEELDIENSKQENPTSWGKWQLKGDVYYLTNSKGNTYDYQLGSGNWFPAFPYGIVELMPAYSNTTSTTIGDGSTLTITKIQFVDDKHFIEGENSGTITPGSSAWKQSEHTGTYQFEKYSVELNFENGKLEKRSFAVGSKGSPAQATSDMIFIGGDAYISETDAP